MNNKTPNTLRQMPKGLAEETFRILDDNMSMNDDYTFDFFRKCLEVDLRYVLSPTQVKNAMTKIEKMYDSASTDLSKQIALDAFFNVVQQEYMDGNKKDVDDEDVIYVSEKDFDKIMETLNNPPEINEKLKQAFRRHNER